MINTLFVINAPLGDSIIFSCFLKDYFDANKDEKIYVMCHPNFIDIFKNNLIVNIYDKNIHYDKVFNYELGKFDNSKNGIEKFENLKLGKTNFQNTPYLYFKLIYNLEIPHNCYIPCIDFDEYQMSKIQSDKPICLINAVAQFYMFDSRYFGFLKYQNIINDFKDKINFISIGYLNYGMLKTLKLNNLWKDLINKTSVYELIHYIYNSKIIITHESGIYHLSCIKSDNIRDVVVPAGYRLRYDSNKYNTPNVNVHWIENIDNSFYKKNCLNGCEIQCVSSPLTTEVNNLKISDPRFVCKFPVFNNGEMLSHCMNHISAEQIENELNEILKK